MVTRREFLKGSAFCAVAPVGGFNQQVTTTDLEVTRLKLPCPEGLSGFKAGFISDIHCGVFLSPSLLESTVSALINEDLDLLILGGDYVAVPDNRLARFVSTFWISNPAFEEKPNDVKKILEYLAESLSEVKPREGVVAVMGNHDHWNNGKLALKIFERYGLQFLINDFKTVRRGDNLLGVYGVDDYWTGRPALKKYHQLRSQFSFKFLVSHNPDYIPFALGNNAAFDLALCGHTHGGQIYVNGLGAPAGYNVRTQELACGLNEYLGQKVYTTRGIGVVDVPLRLNCRPEVTVITLQTDI